MLHLKEFKGVLNNTWVQYSVHKFNAEKPHMQIPQKYLKHRDDPSLFLPENFPFASLYFPKIPNNYLYIVLIHRDLDKDTARFPYSRFKIPLS